MNLLFTLLLLLFNSYFENPAETKLEKQTAQKTFKYLALGDSYTKGESVPLNKSFPHQLLDELKKGSTIKEGEVKIIAQTGWTTTNLKNAIESENDKSSYDLVTLLIGVNNQYQNKAITLYEKEFAELLETAIKMAGGDKNKVVVVSIPDYGYTPFGSDNQANISKGIDAYNNTCKQITIKKAITFVDITTISRKAKSRPELVAADGLHPSSIMYKEWVDLMLPDIKKKIEK